MRPQTTLVQHREHGPQVLDVVFKGLAVHQDVINEGFGEARAACTSQLQIHDPLKCCRRLLEPERDPDVLVQGCSPPKGCEVLGVRVDGELKIPRPQVYFGEEPALPQRLKELLCHWVPGALRG